MVKFAIGNREYSIVWGDVFPHSFSYYKTKYHHTTSTGLWGCKATLGKTLDLHPEGHNKLLII